jgi:hypothetical protein
MEGTTNPWGLDFDEYGEMFVSNSVTPHLYHVIPGSHVMRRRESPLSRFAYGLIPEIADHKHYVGGDWTKSRGGTPQQVAVGGGHAHSGCMLYYGGTFPDEFRGMAFMNNIHGDRVNTDVLARKGSGYTASHGSDFLTVGDPWFQGLQLKYGPDGGVYLSDWYDTGECHTLKPARKNGRIYKVAYNGASRSPTATLDVASGDGTKLIDLLSHRNEWFVRHARRLLQERGLNEAEESRLAAMLNDEKSDVRQRLSALWTLHACGRLSEQFVLGQLDRPEESLRAWGVRLGCESRSPSAAVAERLARLATEDASPLVCLYLASSAQRVGVDLRWQLVERLAQRAELAADANVPLMVWYALEPMVQKDLARALRVASASKLPKLREFVARRIASR